ncbi:hypothetical protein BDW74DRAFT_146535 [Aspergillus multicolor]|uniref:uncharacterized protein n=1 Tax=Aspergillus multicolor TaxID=41759 RepID=UPI003CCCA0FB
MNSPKFWPGFLAAIVSGAFQGSHLPRHIPSPAMPACVLCSLGNTGLYGVFQFHDPRVLDPFDYFARGQPYPSGRSCYADSNPS